MSHRPHDVLEHLPPGLHGIAGLYVVGGAVRDVLLGRTPRELDLVLEGDAVALARRLGDVVAVHERFGTATVDCAGTVVDLASARRERYRQPGALPDVELGAGMREDLARRDFTVNAMAVPVDGGEAVIHSLAMDDLRAGVLRVLHDASFRDDPTRLLRLVRYAARLGFGADPHTAGLANAAVEAGAVTWVSGSRIGAELRLALREPQPAALLALASHGIGAAVLGAYAPDREIIGRALAVAPADANRAVVALAAAIAGAAGSTPEALRARLDALALPARERDATVHAVAAAPGLASALAGSPPPAALWERLRREPAEAVAVAAGLDASAEPAAGRWLADLRHVRTAITGSDLLAAGLAGADVGRGLDAAMRALLDGRAPDRDAQLGAALDARTAP